MLWCFTLVCVRFHENISNGFQLTESAWVNGGNGCVQCSKGNNSKVGRPELWFMCSERCLIVFYICVKFRENITNGIRVMGRTRVHDRNGYVQCSKCNNSKHRLTRVTFMCSAHRLMVFCTDVKVRENFSNGIKVMARIRHYKALTDRRTDRHSKFRTV